MPWAPRLEDKWVTDTTRPASRLCYGVKWVQPGSSSPRMSTVQDTFSFLIQTDFRGRLFCPVLPQVGGNGGCLRQIPEKQQSTNCIISVFVNEKVNYNNTVKSILKNSPNTGFQFVLDDEVSVNSLNVRIRRRKWNFKHIIYISIKKKKKSSTLT